MIKIKIKIIERWGGGYLSVDGFAAVGALVVNLGVDASEETEAILWRHDAFGGHVTPVQAPDHFGRRHANRRTVDDDRGGNVDRNRRHRRNQDSRFRC